MYDRWQIKGPKQVEEFLNVVGIIIPIKHWNCAVLRLIIRMIPVFHQNHHSIEIPESIVLYYIVQNNLLIEWFRYFIGMMILVKHQNRSIISLKTAQFQCFIGKMISTTFRNSSTCLGPKFHEIAQFWCNFFQQQKIRETRFWKLLVLSKVTAHYTSCLHSDVS